MYTVSLSFGKSIAVRVSALIGGVLSSLLLAELALRASSFEFRLYPSEVQFGFPDPVRMRDLYRQDPDLFWVPKDYNQKLETYRKQGVDIVLMGDSCTEFGEYDVFLQQLKESSAALKGFSLGKVGVGGWSSYQGLQQLKRDVLALRPKVISVYFGWNDHWIGFGIEDKAVAELNSPLMSALNELRLVQLLAKAFLVKARDEGEQYPKRVSVEDFRINLKEIVSIAKQNSIVPVLLTAPSSHREGKEPKYLKGRFIKKLSTLVPLHQEYINVVREVANSEDVPVCDLAARFEALPSQDVIDLYFTKDGIHLTEAGNKKIAEFLLECLEKISLPSLSKILTTRTTRTTRNSF